MVTVKCNSIPKIFMRIRIKINETCLIIYRIYYSNNTMSITVIYLDKCNLIMDLFLHLKFVVVPPITSVINSHLNIHKINLGNASLVSKCHLSFMFQLPCIASSSRVGDWLLGRRQDGTRDATDDV